MQKKNLIRFPGFFILLPIVAISIPFGNLISTVRADASTTLNASQTVLTEPNTGVNSLLAYNQAMDEKTQILKAQGKAIDAYFAAHSMPLKGTGLKFAVEADKNGLDWRLLPAIAVRESTGGLHACKSVPNSFFGWGSCKIGFKSKGEAIEVLARNLSGNNPKTEHHYSGKTTKQILQKYNPPSIIPNYANQVMAIMNKIGKETITPQDLAAAQATVSNT